tara:strand:- start:9655 stop:9981 length:327 start_codon:yes stop_codon:yes gene_type:complete
MFDIHLAWSPIEYVLAYIFTAVFVGVCLYWRLYSSKVLIAIVGVMLLLINMMAFDVGTRQVDLHRSQFNTGPVKIENVEKVEVERLTRDKVRVQFEAEIQERKEEYEE